MVVSSYKEPVQFSANVCWTEVVMVIPSLGLWLLALVTCDRWPVTGDTWNLTSDTWYLTPDTRFNIYLLLQFVNYYLHYHTEAKISVLGHVLSTWSEWMKSTFPTGETWLAHPFKRRLEDTGQIAYLAKVLRFADIIVTNSHTNYEQNI